MASGTKEHDVGSEDVSASRPSDALVPGPYRLAWATQIVHATPDKKAESKLDLRLVAVDSPKVKYELEVRDADAGKEAGGDNAGDDLFGSFSGSVSGTEVTVAGFQPKSAPKKAKTGRRGVPYLCLSLNGKAATWVPLWDYLEESDSTWELYLVLKVTPEDGGDTVELRSAAFSVVKRYLEFVPITGGFLREDVAPRWERAVKAAKKAGATLAPPYGDTLRPLKKFSKAGTSKTSIHYCGRAVDINQGLWGTKYFPVLDGTRHWTVWCKAAKQDGTQGEEIEKDTTEYYHSLKVTKVPAGWYVNLTKVLADEGFDRIGAQSGWKKSAIKMEWWHFNYTGGLKPTFREEMAVVGISKKELKDKGWTDAEMERKPG